MLKSERQRRRQRRVPIDGVCEGNQHICPIGSKTSGRRSGSRCHLSQGHSVTPTPRRMVTRGTACQHEAHHSMFVKLYAALTAVEHPYQVQ
jgi:hypothetical protein